MNKHNYDDERFIELGELSPEVKRILYSEKPSIDDFLWLFNKWFVDHLDEKNITLNYINMCTGVSKNKIKSYIDKKAFPSYDNLVKICGIVRLDYYKLEQLKRIHKMIRDELNKQ